MSIEGTGTRIETLLSDSRAIFIISEDGILLHNETFFNFEEDPDLYSGLFSAVNVYSKELHAGKIEVITLDESKFVFSEHDETGYLVVLEINKTMMTEDGHWLLEQIIGRFGAMQKLIAEDYSGSLTLETLFSERGKTIDWDTIQAIRTGAVETKQDDIDHVETLNMSRININNRLWVRIRTIITTLVKAQIGLEGIILILTNREEENVLYCGRNGFETLDNVHKYLLQKMSEGILGLEQETEYVQMDDYYCSIFNLLCLEGGIIGIASIDKFLINKLTNQIERLVATIERLSLK